MAGEAGSGVAAGGASGADAGAGEATGETPNAARPAANAATQTAAQKEAARRLKLQIDGREEEWDEDKVIAFAQKGRAADKRFSDAAQMRKDAERVAKAFKEGTLEDLIESIGEERVQAVAEQFYRAKFEEEDLTPAEKQLRKRERELAKKEAELKRQEEERQNKLSAALEKHYMEQYDKEMTEVLSASSLPKTPYVVHRMAELMEHNLNEGLNLPASTVAKVLEEEMRGSVTELLNAMDGDKLASLLGDSVAKKLRSADLKSLRSSHAKLGPSSTQQGGSKNNAERKAAEAKKPLTKDEWKERMERIKKGLE